MSEKSRYSICLSLCILWLMWSCASPPSRPVYQDEGKNYGTTSGAIFRHRWWNYYERGLSYAEERFYDNAVTDLEAAMAGRQRDQRMARTYGMHFVDYFPHRELGIIYYEIGKLETARDYLLRSIAQYPSAKAYYYLDQVRRMLIRRSGESIAPPQIDIDVHNDVIWTKADPVTIQGIASDPHYIEMVRINDRPLFMAHAQKNFSFKTELSLPQGSHPVKIKARNLGGMTASRYFVINIDRQGPVIVIEQIRPIQSSNGTMLEISGILSDSSGVASAYINSNPLKFEPGPRWKFQYVLPLGVKTLRLNAVDRLGNSTAANIVMDELAVGAPSPLVAASDLTLFSGLLGRRDRISPAIELKDFSDSQTVFMDKIYLDGMVKDLGGITEITVNGKPIQSASGRMIFFNRVVSLIEGSNIIVIAATDKSGNRAQKTIEIIRRVPEAFQLDARLKVSVFPFQHLAKDGQEGAIFQEYLIDALLEKERFRVVERSLLDILLQEHRLSASNLVDPGTVLKVGRLVAAQSIIAGSIVESRQGFEIISRMIDTETSDILVTLDVYGETKDSSGMKDLADGLALKYLREFPLSNGIVINVAGDTILTDLGQKEIKLQRCVIVYRESTVVHPLNNRVLGTDKQILCRARVTQVQAEISKAHLIDKPKFAVEKLYKVVAE